MDDQQTAGRADEDPAALEAAARSLVDAFLLPSEAREVLAEFPFDPAEPLDSVHRLRDAVRDRVLLTEQVEVLVLIEDADVDASLLGAVLSLDDAAVEAHLDDVRPAIASPERRAAFRPPVSSGRSDPRPDAAGAAPSPFAPPSAPQHADASPPGTPSDEAPPFAPTDEAAPVVRTDEPSPFAPPDVPSDAAPSDEPLPLVPSDEPAPFVPAADEPPAEGSSEDSSTAAPVTTGAPGEVPAVEGAEDAEDAEVFARGPVEDILNGGGWTPLGGLREDVGARVRADEIAARRARAREEAERAERAAEVAARESARAADAALEAAEAEAAAAAAAAQAPESAADDAGDDRQAGAPGGGVRLRGLLARRDGWGRRSAASGKGARPASSPDVDADPADPPAAPAADVAPVVAVPSIDDEATAAGDTRSADDGATTADTVPADQAAPADETVPREADAGSVDRPGPSGPQVETASRAAPVPEPGPGPPDRDAADRRATPRTGHLDEGDEQAHEQADEQGDEGNDPPERQPVVAHDVTLPLIGEVSDSLLEAVAAMRVDADVALERRERVPPRTTARDGVVHGPSVPGTPGPVTPPPDGGTADAPDGAVAPTPPPASEHPRPSTPRSAFGGWPRDPAERPGVDLLGSHDNRVGQPQTDDADPSATASRSGRGTGGPGAEAGRADTPRGTPTPPDTAIAPSSLPDEPTTTSAAPPSVGSPDDASRRFEGASPAVDPDDEPGPAHDDVDGPRPGGPVTGLDALAAAWSIDVPDDASDTAEPPGSPAVGTPALPGGPLTSDADEPDEPPVVRRVPPTPQPVGIAALRRSPLQFALVVAAVLVLLLAAFLAVQALRGGVQTATVACAPGAPICLEDAVLTDRLTPSGDPGPPVATFTTDQQILLWWRADRSIEAEDADLKLDVVWLRVGSEPGTDELVQSETVQANKIPFQSVGLRIPLSRGSYVVEVRLDGGDDAALLREAFEVG